MIESANQNPYGGGTIVPPPPETDSSLTEVSIRTMASDLAMLGQTGGATPAGETLSIAFNKPKNPDEKVKVVVKGEGEIEAKSPGRHTPFLWIAIGIVGLILLFLLGYYILPKLISFLTPGTGAAPSNSGTLPPNGELPPVAPPTAPLGNAHTSFFRIPADETLKITLDPAKPQLEESNLFSSAVLAALKTAKSPQSALFELSVVRPDGMDFTWPEFLSVRNAQILSTDLFINRFEPNFTAFVYRDRTNVWPGYIIKLQKEYSPLLMNDLVLGVEKNIPAFMNLFVTSPGAASGSFRDARIAGQPMRSLFYGTPTTTLSYGWFYGSYLIFSTSDEGLKQALQKL